MRYAGRHGTLLLLLSLAGSARASGQVVRGTLINAGAGPEPGVTVILLDSADFTRAQALSNPSGWYGFVTPFPGHFRIKVIRVGFPVWESDPFAVGAKEVVDFNATLPGIPTAPPDFTTGKKCQMRPGESDPAGALLAEARKAFIAADQFLRQSDYRFDVEYYAQYSDAAGTPQEVKHDKDTESDFWPVKSLPVERLQAGGFIQGDDPATGPVYYGPDADVLFSDFFQDNHCFEIAKSKGADTALVGLHFKAATSRKFADLDGTLWLDRATLRLSRLDFTYTHLPEWAPKGSASGRLDFVRLPSGYWTVQRWVLRAPLPERFQGTNWYNFIGYIESGGEITAVRTKAGAVMFAVDSGRGAAH